VEKAEEERDQALKAPARCENVHQHLESRSQTLQKERDEVEVLHITTLNDLRVHRQENAQLREKISALSTENYSLQEENKKIQEKCNCMEQKVAQQTTQLDDLQEEKRDMSDKYSWLEAKEKGLLEDKARLKDDKARLKERIARLEHDNNRQQDHIESFEHEKNELRVRNKTSEECTSLRKENGSLKAERQESRTGLQGQMDVLREENSRLQKERDKLQEEKDGFLNQINELKEEKQVLFAVDQMSQEEQNTLKIERDSLQMERANLQVERDSLETERDNLRREVARLRRHSPPTDSRTGVRKSRTHDGQAQSRRLLIVRSPRDIRTASTIRGDQGFSTTRISDLPPFVKLFWPTLM